VLDVGAGTTSVTPIYDGKVLDGLQYQTLGGEDITKYILQSLKTKFEYDPVPHYLIQTKQPGLPAGQIPNLTIRPHDVLKDSFTSFMKNRLIQDFKETTCQVCETAYNEEFLKPRPSKSYEFPDGFNSSFSLERYEYGELLFNPQRFIKDAQGNPSTYLPISGLIQKTLEAIPPELRAILCSSFVITGGTTGMQGFNDRIAFDITNQLYQSRPKVTAPSSTAERCYSSWLGASIMGSLGTFQQLMVSSRTYKDVGSKAIHEQFN
jgi:actin-related protein